MKDLQLDHEVWEPTWRGCGAELDYALRQLSRKTSRMAPVAKNAINDGFASSGPTDRRSHQTSKAGDYSYFVAE